jgi:hypothetical protein
MPENAVEQLLSVIRIYTGDMAGRIDGINGEDTDNAALW